MQLVVCLLESPDLHQRRKPDIMNTGLSVRTIFVKSSFWQTLGTFVHHAHRTNLRQLRIFTMGPLILVVNLGERQFCCLSHREMVRPTDKNSACQPRHKHNEKAHNLAFRRTFKFVCGETSSLSGFIANNAFDQGENQLRG